MLGEEVLMEPKLFEPQAMANHRQAFARSVKGETRMTKC
jgi:hypothetical protein